MKGWDQHMGRYRYLSGLLVVLWSAPPLYAQETYTVKAGDTLKDIAITLNSSEEAIMQANPKVTSPDRIWPGQKLLIPGASAAPTNVLAPTNPAAAPGGPRKAVGNEVLMTYPPPQQERYSLTAPAGRLEMDGLTRIKDHGQWDLVLPECKSSFPCGTTLTITNVGDVPVTTLKVSWDSWLPGVAVTTTCTSVLDAGAACTANVLLTSAPPRSTVAMIMVGAEDALFSPEQSVVWATMPR